jgi:hypothetical protein
MHRSQKLVVTKDWGPDQVLADDPHREQLRAAYGWNDAQSQSS